MIASYVVIFFSMRSLQGRNKDVMTLGIIFCVYLNTLDRRDTRWYNYSPFHSVWTLGKVDVAPAQCAFVIA